MNLGNEIGEGLGWCWLYKIDYLSARHAWRNWVLDICTSSARGAVYEYRAGGYLALHDWHGVGGYSTVLDALWLLDASLGYLCVQSSSPEVLLALFHVSCMFVAMLSEAVPGWHRQSAFIRRLE
jgi:hypothetical protein